MRNKIAALKVIAALGIPLFPLGALFFPPPTRMPVFSEKGEAPQEIPEIPAAIFKDESFVDPERPVAEAFPPVGAEALARVFSPPDKTAAGEEPQGEDIIAETNPVSGEGKFSYLGSIRDSGDQEWLYITEEETGRIISVDTSLGSSNEERCVVEIEGTSYFIRRK
jgi:hypothetical protein